MSNEQEIINLKGQVESFVEDKAWSTKRIKELQEKIAFKDRELEDVLNKFKGCQKLRKNKKE